MCLYVLRVSVLQELTSVLCGSLCPFRPCSWPLVGHASVVEDRTPYPFQVLRHWLPYQRLALIISTRFLVPALTENQSTSFAIFPANTSSNAVHMALSIPKAGNSQGFCGRNPVSLDEFMARVSLFPWAHQVTQIDLENLGKPVVQLQAHPKIKIRESFPLLNYLTFGCFSIIFCFFCSPKTVHLELSVHSTKCRAN